MKDLYFLKEKTFPNEREVVKHTDTGASLPWI